MLDFNLWWILYLMWCQEGLRILRVSKKGNYILTIQFVKYLHRRDNFEVLRKRVIYEGPRTTRVYPKAQFDLITFWKFKIFNHVLNKIPRGNALQRGKLSIWRCQRIRILKEIKLPNGNFSCLLALNCCLYLKDAKWDIIILRIGFSKSHFESLREAPWILLHKGTRM